MESQTSTTIIEQVFTSILACVVIFTKNDIAVMHNNFFSLNSLLLLVPMSNEEILNFVAHYYIIE
jgi:hypothetical protein